MANICDGLKAFITGFMRSGITYKAKGAAGKIKEAKYDMNIANYRQQIKALCLKYVFQAAKIIKNCLQCCNMGCWVYIMDGDHVLLFNPPF